MAPGRVSSPPSDSKADIWRYLTEISGEIEAEVICAVIHGIIGVICLVPVFGRVTQFGTAPALRLPLKRMP